MRNCDSKLVSPLEYFRWSRLCGYIIINVIDNIVKSLSTAYLQYFTAYLNLLLGEQIGSGGGTGVTMRDGDYKGDTKPSHAISQPKTSSNNSKAQVSRIKNIKDYLENTRRDTDTQYKSKKNSAGKMEERLTNIERMMSKLKSVVEERRKEREIESNRSQTSRQKSDGDKEVSVYGKFQYWYDLRRHICAVPCLCEFTEESNKCVDSYSLIDEVKKVTRCPPKRVSGNKKRLVTVEVSTKEESEKIASIKQVAHPRFN